MFNILKAKTNYNFSSKFSLAAIFSTVIVIVSLVLIFTRMQYGVDFRGGAEIEVGFKDKINLSGLRKTLKKGGFKGASVQSLGEIEDNNYLIKVSTKDKKLNEVTDQITKSLTVKFGATGIDIRKIDIVGPKAGHQLRLSGILAMFWALIAIMIYVGLRFEFVYAPGAILALFHDVSIVLGVFVLTNTEFSLQTVAALLAVIGYSVNDTVIVYDRVREHVGKNPHKPLREHINDAINNTLSRTILTSGTTLFVALSMYFFGGIAIKNFFMAITLGIIVGTYSSIFVAAPITLFFDRISKKEKSSSSKLANA